MTLSCVAQLTAKDTIQRDIDRLERWASVKLMKFNKVKWYLTFGYDSQECKLNQNLSHYFQKAARIVFTVLCSVSTGAQTEIQQETGSKYTEDVQQKHNTSTTVSSKVNIIQPMLTNPVITPSNPAHNGRVCSTWGNFHFKTFDGDIFSFPGLCNYIFASHCNAPYEDFNIQIRRVVVDNAPTISRITMKLEGVAAELTKGVVMINGNRVQLPYSQSGITIEKSSIYMKVVSKMGIVLMWNEDDNILLELNEKYANQTCGLCGDFNGLPIYNEFYSNSIKMTALQFGNMQKMDGPTEHCEDSTSTPPDNCTESFDDICQKTLTSTAFADCNDLVDVREYIKTCQDDLCHSEESKNSSCICDTFAEYSRQCAHAGGHPLNWRTSKLCPKKCPYNMQYQECSSPCADTCTNPERSQFCEEHCMDGCFCPPGTVFDDINSSGCISQEQCSCVYNGNTYATGASFTEQCHSCTCNGGQWTCQDTSCPGTCSVEGGSHISTYDKKRYDHHGDCTYVLSKHCKDETFTILVELRQCGLTDTETCLKTVTLNMNKGQTLVEVKPDGGVFVNSIYTQLPFSAANVTVFRPSSFFIMMQTNFGVQLEIQIVPIMQVFVRLDPIFKNQTCGLCGNFNNIQTDDFKAISGIIEGTATAFANTWRTQASCPNIQPSFENPCALSIDNEKYAQHWCGLLTDSKGPFAACHYAVNPSVYHMNCMFDTCNCENSEDCLCAALSSYVRACSAKGIQLQGWRTEVCSKYTTSCPKSLSYSYTISACQPTCRSLSEHDVTCDIKFVPVDGCTCVNETYMDESGKCVPANECPCYYRGSPIPFGEAVHENGLVCTCIQGRLNCIGAPNPNPVCESPMVYFNCRNVTAGIIGAECQKSCQTLDMQCYSTQCVSGCMCPAGLVLDGNGGCIPEEECPCIHNEAMYQPGEKISVDCNTCVCKNRKWECTEDQCLGTCAVYGDGHYNTFDDKRFSFNGNCEYTLVQDHCGKSGTANGTFRVITENIPCGNTGTTCSKSIKVFLESYELILGEEHVSVVKRGQNDEVPYTVRYMGVYLVIETKSGLILMWDKKTSIFIKLSPNFKGQVCGLCGNYDGNGINDFTTRSQSVVENVLEFGNSWKVSSTCPDASSIKDTCSTNPYRKSWSEKQCSIINSNVFAACHSQVEPAKYYQACVTDACACDTGGDCDCFCTAVAAYAQACSEVGTCIAWRTPSICPLFCDYYNHQGECEWHYKPCGASCMKTCRNPSGKCFHDLPGLEGCYPNCPPDKPYFHEDQMKCVSLCDCYDSEDGKIYRRDECNLCECTSEGLQCKFDEKACNCIYEGNTYKYGELIYNTTDTAGWCFSATCDVNRTISRSIFKCGISTTTPFTFSTSQPTTTTSGTAKPVTTVCVKHVCTWSEWYDSTQPENNEDSGDYEIFENLREKGYRVCKNPDGVQCRAKEHPNTEINNLNQTVQCSQNRGLICNNKDQSSKQCYNYEIRISCCRYVPCSEIETTTTSTTEFTTTAVKSTAFTVNTKIKPTTEKKHTQAQNTEVPKTSTKQRESTTQPPTSPTTSSTLPPTEVTTTTGTTVVPSTTAPPTQTTSIITTTTRASTAKTSPAPMQSTTVIAPTPTVPTTAASSTSTSRTSEGSTTTSPATTPPAETSTTATQPPTSPTTASTLASTEVTTTTGTTVVPSTTAPPTQTTSIITTTTAASTARTSPAPTQSTTVIAPTPTVPTTATSSTSTSRTSEGSTTTSPANTPPAETTTTATQPPTSPTTASTLASTEVTTTTGTTVVPSTTAPPTQTTSIITTTSTASTARTSPAPIQSTTILTPTPTAPASASTSTAITSETTNSCQPRCAWTQWFNVDSPSPGTQNGDMETFEKIRAAGYALCSQPQDIQCRAKDYPSRSLDTLGQVVECSLNFGLVCRNEDQITKYPICFDYKIKVLCCDRSHCQTTSASPGTTTGSSTTASTAETSTTTTQPPTSPTTASTLASTEVTTTTGTTVLTSTAAPPTQTTPIITSTTRASTAKTSPAPTQSTTVIAPTPTVPTTAASSTSTSRTSEGSTTTSPATTPPAETSTTATQPPTSPTTASTLASTEVTTTTGTTVVPSTTAPPTQTTSIITTTTAASTARTSPAPIQSTTILTPTPTAPTSASTSTASTSETTNSCQPRCAWTQWFNVDSPSPGTQNGDKETFEKIRAAGYALCNQPQDIQCRAKDYPSRSLDTLGQVVECSLNFGLVCRNEDQITKHPICFDYEIKVLCCDRSHCQTTSASPGTTTGSSTTASTAETSTTTTQPPTSPTTASTLASTEVTTTTGTTVVTSTTAPPTQTTPIITTTSTASTARTSPAPTQSTTVIAPTPTVPTTATSSTSTSRTSEGSTTTSPVTTPPAETTTTATQPPTSPTTASTLASTEVTTTTGTTVVPSTTAPPTQTTSIITTTSTASTARTSPAPIQSTTILTPTPTAPASASTSTAITSETTNSCQPRCAWTQWFNVDSPSPGTQNGDMETFEKIRAAGYALCSQPQDIQCRAKDYPSRSLDTLGQVVECSLNFGLVCRNEDQITKYPICFDYKIKVLCCDRSHCQTTSASPGTTTGSSTTASTAETSTTTTQPPTSPTTASTLASTEVTTTTGTTVLTSTAAPPTQTTPIITSTTRASTAKTSPAPTQSTTVIAPTPTVPTTAASSTSTSRTSEGSTTTSPATTPPAETSTTATQPPTSPTTASTLASTEVTTTTGTTVVPSTTAPPTQTTSIITTTTAASTARTSPAPIQSTTILTPTPTAPTSASTSTASTSETTNSCQPRCAWTQWFNVDSPSPGTQNGDMETFEKIHAAGYALCNQPQDIQCRAKDYPSRSLDTLGQVVECSLNFGLVCRNEDQITKHPICFDYEIKVLCCDRSHCQTTSASPGTTTGSSTTASTAETSTTTTQPPTSPTTASTLASTEVTTTTGTTVVTSTTAPPTQTTPIITTTSTASTARTSPAPTQSTTVIAPTPTVPTTATSSTSTSRTSEGSTTTSPANTPPAETTTTATQPPTSPTTASTLASTEVTTTTGTTVVPSTTAPPTQTTSVITTTSTASTARTSPAPIQSTTILTPTPTAPTSASTSTASTSETTNSCQPRCAWTQWFNVDSPSPGTQNGDMETFEKIHAAGYALCNQPQDIQCRAKDYPSRRLDTLGQVVECSLNFGLVCRNEDQITKHPICFDYEIKVLCCDRSHCQTTSASPGTTTGSSTTASTAETSTTTTQPPTSPTTASTLASTEVTTTTGTTVVTSTTAPPTQTTPIITTTSTASTARTSPAPTQSTTVIAPTPTVPTTAASSTSTSRTSEGSTTTSPATTPPAETSTTATQPPTSPTTASTLASTEVTTTTGTTVVPSTTAPPTQTTSVITTTSTASTARTSPAPIQSTTILTPTPTAPTSASTSTASTSETTNSCQPRCAWTQWFNVDSPSPGTQNGDMETFEKIHAAGYALCNQPQDIQCRAKDYPSRRLDTLGQVVECSLNFGLVCRNEDQITKHPICFDYEIKVLCCDRSHCQTTSASPGTTTGSSTTASTAETSTTTTQPPTSPTTASTLASTEVTTTTGTTVVTSTTAPPTQTTPIITTTSTASTARTSPAPTQSTTVIAPTPTVPTTAASSTSTSRTSEGSTTTSPATTPPAETSTTATQPPTSPTTASTLASTEVTTTTGTTVVPSTTAPPTQTTSIITTTTAASTARTSPAPIQSTTILTPTPTAPTSASTSTASTSETTNSCQPRCAWTQWFNVDSPSPGTQNGDMETFEKIHAAGYALCNQPQDIQCRAKDYPSRSLDTLGQVVECSLNFGLVCRNEDQITKHPICFDYEIKVLCCDRSHCQTTSASPGTTTGSSTTASTAETSTTTTQPPTSPTTASTLASTEVTTTTGTTVVPSTTAPPTQTTPIITTTSTASTARTSPAPIQSTTILTPTPTAPASASTSTASTSETTNSCQPRCAWTQWFNVDSPSPGTQNGDMETFEKIHAAGYALCNQPQDIQCRAKDYPSRSLDTLGQVVECSLNFGLVCRNEDQITKHPICFDYEIKVLCCDRSHCQTTSASPGTTTGSSTTASTAETSTTATQPPTSPTTASTLASTEVTTTTGTTVVPSTTAPPTQTTPIITTTSTGSTARTSLVPLQSTTILTPPTPTVPTTAASSTSTSRTSEGSTTTSPATTPPAETSTVVTQPPTSPTTASSVPKTVATSGTPQSSHFTTRTSAIFSSSMSTPVTTEASTYVTSSKTTPCFCHVLGHFFSPGEVVYNRTDQAGCNFYALCTKECEIDPFQGPCPSTTPFTSVTSETTIQATSSTEHVFSSVSPTTATSLTTAVERNCTDVNPPRKPGENWTSECKMCVCDPVTVTVQCQPLPCQTVQTPVCDAGFVSVPVLPEDPCCPEFECRRIPDTCVINGTMYTVGMSTIINSCKKCTCTSEKDPVTDENIVHCERVQCETSCPMGHQYMTEDGECCGKCIEVACKIKLSNNTVHVLNVDEILPLDNCSHYKCEKIEDQFVAVQTKRVCPEYNPGECIPDEAETTPDGCCKICRRK
ncbi:mucin-5AC-like [Phaenicophaeus curvirostris]|uniref:mucin-5AC-like n=1 Tax=Phaenicophaeus curvirostris TaxID=33595 RepID=UPI0037F0AD99